MSSSKPKLLWISDAGIESGFARVTHNILGWLGSHWERVVLGVNYKGDPHGFPYRIYPAMAGGDLWGFGRFAELVRVEKPDIILIQSDAWIVNTFLEIAATMDDCPPIAAFMPVDASGVKRSVAKGLSKLDFAAFYSDFAVEQVRKSGFTGNGFGVSLGVRREIYKPMSKDEARRLLKFDLPAGAFLVGNVNRNQPRKRQDLTIKFFAEWLKRGGDGYLYLHCLREDIGWDLQEIADYYGISDRFYMPAGETYADLIQELGMSAVYSALDVQVSTCMGEGFGLPTLEGMACGVPQVVPDFAALGEWPKGAVINVPVEHGAANFGFKSFGIGATPLEEPFIEALDHLASDPEYRAELGRLGFERAAEPRFQWCEIAKRFHNELSAVLSGRTKAAA